MSIFEREFETIRVESPADYLGQVVLDRPEKLNTISDELLDELEEAIDGLVSGEEDVRAIFLTGAGEKAFSAGADLGGGGSADPLAGVEHSRRGQRVFGTLREIDLPVIAGIDGYALGGGLELSMCADLRVASESSTFGLPEHDRGLLPGWGGTQRLQREIGVSAAKQVVFTAEKFSADRMYDFGYLYAVYDDDSFEEEALEFATEISQGPPIAQKYTKRAMREGWEHADAGLEIESQAMGHLMGTEDLMEGITAFAQNRDPEFEGK